MSTRIWDVVTFSFYISVRSLSLSYSLTAIICPIYTYIMDYLMCYLYELEGHWIRIRWTRSGDCLIRPWPSFIVCCPWKNQINLYYCLMLVVNETLKMIGIILYLYNENHIKYCHGQPRVLDTITIQGPRGSECLFIWEYYDAYDAQNHFYLN